MAESDKAAAYAKNLTHKERDDMAANTWDVPDMRIGRRRDSHFKMLAAVGQRGGELTDLRVQQLRVFDVGPELAAIPRARKVHKFGGDTRILRWIADEKAAGKQDRTRCMVRAPEVEQCPVSAMALHLSYEVDMARRTSSRVHFGSLLSEIISGDEVMLRWGPEEDQAGMLPRWYSTYLYHGVSIDRGLCKSSLWREVTHGLAQSNIDYKTAVQHLFRYSRVRVLRSAGGDAAAAADRPWQSGNVFENTYDAVSLDLDGTMGWQWGSEWREYHISGRCAATWALLEGEAWLKDPATKHLTGIPDYVRAHLFSGLPKEAGESDFLKDGTSSARAVIDVFLWMRETFMQDMPFWLQAHGDHPFWRQHPLFAFDLSGVFREWLRLVWSPLVMRLHGEGARELRGARIPTYDDISELLRGTLEAEPRSPEEGRKTREIARAFAKLASPSKPTLQVPAPTRRQTNGKPQLHLARSPEGLGEVMAEYLVGANGHPPLRPFMTDFQVDRVATWASDPREGGWSCKAEWGRRKHLVRGVMGVAEWLPGGVDAAVERLEQLVEAEYGMVPRVFKLQQMARPGCGNDIWMAFVHRD